MDFAKAVEARRKEVLKLVYKLVYNVVGVIAYGCQQGDNSDMRNAESKRD